MEYRKWELDSDDEDEMRDLQEERSLARRAKVLRQYIPSQPVVKRPVVEQRGNLCLAGCSSWSREGPRLTPERPGTLK